MSKDQPGLFGDEGSAHQVMPRVIVNQTTRCRRSHVCALPSPPGSTMRFRPSATILGRDGSL